MLKLYTDGAQRDNTGAWALVALDDNGVEIRSGIKEGGSSCNNEVELFAILKALYYIFEKDAYEAVIYTDAMYILTGLDKVEEWKENDWCNKKGKPIKNSELWANVSNILTVMGKVGIYNVSIKKIKAHSGNAFNERADKEAKEQLNKHLGGAR